MSASNWRMCPRCIARVKAERAATAELAEQAYGVQPIEEFLKLREEALKPIQLDATMREDYNGIGVQEDGVFRVSYRSYCDSCGFSFDFTHEQPTEALRGARP